MRKMLLFSAAVALVGLASRGIIQGFVDSINSGIDGIAP